MLGALGGIEGADVQREPSENISMAAIVMRHWEWGLLVMLCRDVVLLLLFSWWSRQGDDRR